jgi:diguanylate cyclase (GGDEF)-like protein
VLFIDLDGFKPVNDSIGHSAGDEVLRTVASRLSDITRVEDVLARLAGDEFLVVSAGLPDVDVALAFAERMLDAIRREIPVCDSGGDVHQVAVGASIGIVFVTDPNLPADQVIRNADVAMYRAKQRGRGRVEIFGEPLRQAVEERQFMREELRRAIRERELEFTTSRSSSSQAQPRSDSRRSSAGDIRCVACSPRARSSRSPRRPG